MSIWSSWAEIGTDVRTRLAHDEHGEPMLVKSGRQPRPERGRVRSYATGFSNHYPTCDGKYEQPANVGISSIPEWCVPGHVNGEDNDYESVGEWVRLDVQTAEHDSNKGGKSTGRYDLACVVLDETAARALAADLLEWADRPKAAPIKPPDG